MKFKFLEHTADVKFRSYGSDLEEAFANAGNALNQTIYGKIKIKEKIKKKINIKGKDKENLLLNFLEEFLFLLDSEDLIVGKIDKLKIKNNKLECNLIGDKASNYKFTNHVKAVTYNQMFVKKDKNKFICQVVLDV